MYEAAFPQEERVPISYLWKLLFAKEKGDPQEQDLVAALDSGNHLLGLFHINHSPRLRSMALYYLAVSPLQRSQGLGAQIYQEVLQRCRDADCRLLIFDLEDPQHCPTPEAQGVAQRRIGFYSRQGAHLLDGTQYLLKIFSHLPEVHLRIMAHPLEPVTADEVLTAARELLSESVEQIEPLCLREVKQR